jgi:hypothetical protein
VTKQILAIHVKDFHLAKVSCKGKNRDNSKNRQFENITISSTRF